MVRCKNLYDNANLQEIDGKGDIKVFEYTRDLSVNPENAVIAYYSSEMNIRKRQVLIELNNNSYTLSAGAMQWIAGKIEITSDVKGVGDFFKKAVAGGASKESAIKPKYEGTGLLMLEPTYKHILIEEVSEWDSGIVLEDGMFLACDSRVEQKIVSRSSLSSALIGNEGLFNLSLSGSGLAVLESPIPKQELILFEIEDDEVRIDGNFAVAWSASLKFTVEKSTRSLIGSAVSGEGFVNVYRGTGKVLIAPVG